MDLPTVRGRLLPRNSNVLELFAAAEGDMRSKWRPEMSRMTSSHCTCRERWDRAVDMARTMEIPEEISAECDIPIEIARAMGDTHAVARARAELDNYRRMFWAYSPKGK